MEHISHLNPGGLPAFNDVLRTIVNLWQDNREQIEQKSEEITKHLRNSYLYKPPSDEISPDLIDNAFEQLVLQFDSDYGGFGADVAAWSAKNPKFPLPSYLSFLLRYYHRKQEQYALKMVTKTLYAMARGGIYDQLGGGFHRYSTDRYWLVPHFEKIITRWNSLMISSFAVSYQVLRERRFLDAATSATQFILKNLSKERQLFRRYRAGEASIPATLEDYAFLIAALLDLYEACFDPKWLREAFQLNDRVVEMFWDKANGGFFFNRSGETELPASIKELYDGPIPSGNSIAAQNLLRIAALTDNEELRILSKNIFRTFGAQLEQSPLEHTQMLCALDFYLSSPMQVVIASQKIEEAQAFTAEISRHFMPNTVIASTPSRDDELSGLIPLITDKVAVCGKPTVYICENYTCKAPITDLDDLRRVLSHYK